MTVMWLKGFRSLLQHTMPLWLIGGQRSAVDKCGETLNSDTQPPEMSRPGSLINAFACTSKRLGTQMSSASIRATNSFSQFKRPRDNAAPKPQLVEIRTMFIGRYRENLAMVSSNAAPIGPSITTTTSDGDKVCAKTLSI